MKLHLHVKTCYFDQIRDGTKKYEYRLVKPFWLKRLFKDYEGIVVYNAYKPGAENRLDFKWNGVGIISGFKHPHFGTKRVNVYAIPLEP